MLSIHIDIFFCPHASFDLAWFSQVSIFLKKAAQINWVTLITYSFCSLRIQKQIMKRVELHSIKLMVSQDCKNVMNLWFVYSVLCVSTIRIYKQFLHYSNHEYTLVDYMVLICVKLAHKIENCNMNSWINMPFERISMNPYFTDNGVAGGFGWVWGE